MTEQIAHLRYEGPDSSSWFFPGLVFSVLSIEFSVSPVNKIVWMVVTVRRAAGEGYEVI